MGTQGFGSQGFNTGVFGGGTGSGPTGGTPTVLDILYRAYRLAAIPGIIRMPIRGLSQEEIQEGLIVLNPLVDQWNSEKLNIWTYPRSLFNLAPNQNSYAIGIQQPGGPAPDWALARPAKIEYASIVLTSNQPVPLELPMTLLTYPEWQQIPTKNTPSTFPIWGYYDQAFPFGNFNVYPDPQTVNQVALYAGQLLATFATVNDPVVCPYGYLKAFQYQVALELCIHWGKPVSPDLRKEAQEAIGKIKSANTLIADVSCDSAVVASGGTYNWITDGYQKRRG